jgi:hypothetical protein
MNAPPTRTPRIAAPAQGRTVALTITAVLAIAASAARGDPASEARDVVARMVKAHGGLDAWRNAPAVSFTDRFVMPDGSETSSRVIVEQGRRRSTLDVLGSDAHMAWDGEKAWSVDWDQDLPPRFLAQLDYYFLNLVWLTQDPGVHLAHEGRRSVRGSGTEYHLVRMTFGEGVGDTPEDYYLLFVDPDTHRLHGCEYIVTYAPILPEGVKTTPPHELIYDEWAEVDGLLVPLRYTIYAGAAVYAEAFATDWDFEARFDPASVRMPEGAVIDRSLD